MLALSNAAQLRGSNEVEYLTVALHAILLQRHGVCNSGAQRRAVAFLYRFRAHHHGPAKRHRDRLRDAQRFSPLQRFNDGLVVNHRDSAEQPVRHALVFAQRLGSRQFLGLHTRLA